ncbi:MAG: hypothetical protein N2712_06880 [Brevinematales bacterium]|nr:hypothetical protein [Brevinematales bacterium]
MLKSTKNQIENAHLDIKNILLKDSEVLIYNLKRFIDTYREIGNVSQQTVHLIRTRSLKLSSLVRSLYKLHNISILKRFYIYTYQIAKSLGKVRDMDTMIGLLNNEKSPRSLVKDFSTKRHKYMKEAYKKISHSLDKYVETVNQLLDELENPKYKIRFKDIYKIYKIITNEYQFAKLSFMLEPSYELFNRARAKVKNMKYAFWLLKIFFSHIDEKGLHSEIEENLKFINDFQKSLSYFRDVITLVSILSKTSLRVSRKKDFVESFLNNRRNIWKDTIENFKDRHIRVDYRINNIQRELNKIDESLHPPEIERYERITKYIEEFVVSHGGEVEKSKVMAEIAVNIYRSFDKLNLLVYEPVEEFIIKGSCLIHDIGKVSSKEIYHKASMEIFANAEIHEIKTKEKLLIAIVTRYHTRSIPKYSHKWYTNLKDHDKMLINKLSGFVRLAFAICSATNFNSKFVDVEFTRDRINIFLCCGNETKELIVEDMDKALLEKFVGIPINIILKPYN